MLVLFIITPSHWVYFVYTFLVTYIDFVYISAIILTILFN